MIRGSLIAFAHLALLSGAVAVEAEDLEQCLYSSKAPSYAASAEICSRLIASGRFRGDELARLYASRMGSFYTLDRYDQAIADANEIITNVLRQPAHAKIPNGPLKEAYYYRGESYYWTKEYAKATADLSIVIENYPDDPNALHGRGAAYLKLNDLERAISDFSGVIRIRPDYVLAYKDRALAYEQKNDLPRALADIRRAIQIEQSKGGSSFTNLQIANRIEAKLGATPSTDRVTTGLSPPPANKQSSPPASSQVAVAPTASPKSANPPAPVAAAGKRVALVIGNGAYRHNTALANPPNDAADIAKLLRKLGFDVVEGRELDKRGMEEKIREFGRKLDRAELALFYYAGHGLQVAGKNYLLPIDGKLERPADLHFDAIDVHFVLAQMEADQRVNLIFLDACRDNPLARSLARSLGTRSGSVGQGLASIQGSLGTMIGYATQPDAVALDGDGRNSPFTAAMVKHLSTPGLEIGTLMRRVRADVVAATGGKQVPWDHSSLIGEVVLAR